MAARAVAGRRTGTRGPAGGAIRRPMDNSWKRVVRVPEEPFNSLKTTTTEGGEGIAGPIRDA